ncbi:Immunity protein 35 [Streptomyces wuyuanensis]|uniref:Immunity protein 35 n=2 Tax=Streptomyces wuyuanensis TaxID=1196353 RepID=A0A1H0DDU6_9ACTN|nr:Immunity protein 35 [Streptomyces wuyuanensis]
MTDAVGMIEREFAIKLVAAQLEREYRNEMAVYGRSVGVSVAHVEEHDLCWIVSWQSDEYLRTRDHRHALVGNGPYLVDKADGSLHQIGVVDAVTGAWEREYLARIKRQAAPGPVDALHEEVRAAALAQGRVDALRLLRRRVPALRISDAKVYVAALLADADPPAELVAAATEALPRPAELISHGIATITGPNTPTEALRPLSGLPGLAPHRCASKPSSAAGHAS